jgi:hypothetical protein
MLSRRFRGRYLERIPAWGRGNIKENFLYF